MITVMLHHHYYSPLPKLLSVHDSYLQHRRIILFRHWKLVATQVNVLQLLSQETGMSLLSNFMTYNSAGIFFGGG